MRVDERALTERLIGYDTSDPEGIRKAAGFVKGWLESRDIPVEELEIRGLPVLAASVGRRAGPDRRAATATSTSSRATRSSSRRGSRATASTAAAPTT